MNRSNPSGELVGPLEHNATLLDTHWADSSGTSLHLDGARLMREAASALTNMEKRIGVLEGALRAARVIIVEDANACRAFRHESEGLSGSENVLLKIDATLKVD